jgi:glucose-1-phosphate adenylyltransferase
MEEVMGVINVANEEDTLQALTEARCGASVPFGGRYRLIDFALSSMVNSGIKSVAVLTNDRARSLMDHLGSGADWDLDRKHGGLFVLPSPASKGGVEGDIALLHRHRDYFWRGSQQHVLLCGSRVVCNIDFRQAILFHKNTGADITVLYKKIGDGPGRAPLARTLDVREDGRVIGMDEELGFTGSNNISLDMYIVEKACLLALMEECVREGRPSFVRDALIRNLGRLKVYAYPYHGYAATVRTLEDYYVENLNLLQPDVWERLFLQGDAVYTKVKDEPPALYRDSARVTNSLVANGCIIEGTVENSILFRGVKIGKGAHIKNSILMQHCEIGENAYVECTIADKGARIGVGRALTGREDFPLLVAKRAVM